MFVYPSLPHERRHGPAGYFRYENYKQWLRDEFTFRCAYCLMRERWYPDADHSFSVEHIVPQSIDPSLDREYQNLAYVCHRCNSMRRDHDILDPTFVAFGLHVRIDDDGTIRGLTPKGTALIALLKLDTPNITAFRQQIIRTIRDLEQSDAEDASEVVLDWLGFPNDLPNLLSLRPPSGNTRPAGAEDCYYEQRKRGTLPESY